MCLSLKLSPCQRQKEDALNKILLLEKQLDTKQTLEMEIQELKGKLQVMKHLGDDDDEAVQKKMKEMNDELDDKKAELEDLESMNSVLMTKERQSNDEIQAARKKLIAVQISNALVFLGTDTVAFCNYNNMILRIVFVFRI